MDCQYNHKLAVVCGLVSIPSRRKFDKRLKTISTDVKQRISTMGYLFAAEGVVMVDDDHSIAAVDSTLMKAKGNVWHKSSMKKVYYRALASIQVQDEAIAIPRDGYLDTYYI
jgi:Holliday junction resolvasome RuvABC endonuclease subunit